MVLRSFSSLDLKIGSISRNINLRRKIHELGQLAASIENLQPFTMRQARSGPKPLPGQDLFATTTTAVGKRRAFSLGSQWDGSSSGYKPLLKNPFLSSIWAKLTLDFFHIDVFVNRSSNLRNIPNTILVRSTDPVKNGAKPSQPHGPGERLATELR